MPLVTYFLLPPDILPAFSGLSSSLKAGQNIGTLIISYAVLLIYCSREQRKLEVFEINLAEVSTKFSLFLILSWMQFLAYFPYFEENR
jgi:hypothetical protein